jgi:hypothetical protein
MTAAGFALVIVPLLKAGNDLPCYLDVLAARHRRRLGISRRLLGQMRHVGTIVVARAGDD